MAPLLLTRTAPHQHAAHLPPWRLGGAQAHESSVRYDRHRIASGAPPVFCCLRQRGGGP